MAAIFENLEEEYSLSNLKKLDYLFINHSLDYSQPCSVIISIKILRYMTSFLSTELVVISFKQPGLLFDSIVLTVLSIVQLGVGLFCEDLIFKPYYLPLIWKIIANEYSFKIYFGKKKENSNKCDHLRENQPYARGA